jgi:hypothetical protein
MHKRIMQAGLALALAAVSAAALADIQPKDLEVRGTIRTPTCQVIADNDGTYDLGIINMANIPTTGHLALLPMSRHWTVDCGEGVTFMGFQVMDNRAESVSMAGNTNFGLGSVEGFEGSKIGYYTVMLEGAFVDGFAVHTIKGAKLGGSGAAAETTTLDKTMSHSWAQPGTTTPLAGSKFDMNLTVQANIANKTTMGADITAGVPLDGHLTLTYSFGL